jgi:hypothetical protein
LDRYGHLFPDALQRLADRLQEAHAEAVTDPARTDDGSVPVRLGRLRPWLLVDRQIFRLLLGR